MFAKKPAYHAILLANMLCGEQRFVLILWVEFKLLAYTTRSVCVNSCENPLVVFLDSRD